MPVLGKPREGRTPARVVQDPRTDVELVAGARAGDRAAFDALVRRHFRRVYALLFRLAGNHEDAEDMTQECFVKAHHSLEWFRGDASFATWVERIALHLARDRRRREGSRREEGSASPLAELALAPDAAPERDAARRELSLRLAEALRRLPESLRVVVTLRLFEGREYEEIGELTGVRAGTVRTQLMRARRLLLDRLRPWLERSPRP